MYIQAIFDRIPLHNINSFDPIQDRIICIRIARLGLPDAALRFRCRTHDAAVRTQRDLEFLVRFSHRYRALFMNPGRDAG